jgi:outer membrane protein
MAFFSRALGCISLSAILIGVSDLALAETLQDALAAAYLYNPTLKSARAQLRATDNGVAQAKSGYRPTITALVQGGYENSNTQLRGGSPNGSVPFCAVSGGSGPCTPTSSLPLSSITGASAANGSYAPRSAQINLQQSIFDGFRTYNNVKGAEALVEAGREDLRSAEVNVLLTAATAYMNVFRDQAIVNLRRNNVRVLLEQLQATKDRYKVGEVTRADMAEAQSALAQSQADLSIAQGTLYGDQALFTQYIGHAPGSLKDPGPPLRLMPGSLDAAVSIAEAENPGILAAIFRERAQDHQVQQAKGQLLPSVSLNASYARNTDQGGPQTGVEEDVRVFGTVSVPLYEAGSVSAQIRQAMELRSQRRQQIDEQRELARSTVMSQWGLVIAAKGNLAAGKSAVQATRVALDGVRQEERVGQRTILDVLNSQQQYLNSQVQIASFQRDLVVACYGVLAGMGRLTASDISLQTELYDPTRYFDSVADAWFGWSASIESREDPSVAPVTASSAQGQRSMEGPAYTQTLPQVP